MINDLSGNLVSSTVSASSFGFSDSSYSNTSSIQTTDGKWVFAGTGFYSATQLTGPPSSIANISVGSNGGFIGGIPDLPPSEDIFQAPSSSALTTDSRLFYQQTDGIAYIYDPAQSTKPAVATGLSSAVLSSDGTTIVGLNAQGKIALTTIQSPSVQTTLATGHFVDITKDNKLIYLTGASSNELRSYDLAQKSAPVMLNNPGLIGDGGGITVTNLQNQTFANIAPEFLGVGGNKVTYVYHSSSNPGADCVWMIVDSSGNTALNYPDPLCQFAVSATPDGNSALIQKPNQTNPYLVGFTTINFGSGSAEASLTSAGQPMINFWQAHKSNWMVVVELTANHMQQVFAIRTDGSGRINLGSPLPLSREVIAAKFFNNDQSVIIHADAVQTGQPELFRFDLQN